MNLFKAFFLTFFLASGFYKLSWYDPERAMLVGLNFVGIVLQLGNSGTLF
jgi:hypothetical protein